MLLHLPYSNVVTTPDPRCLGVRQRDAVLFWEMPKKKNKRQRGRIFGVAGPLLLLQWNRLFVSMPSPIEWTIYRACFLFRKNFKAEQEVILWQQLGDILKGHKKDSSLAQITYSTKKNSRKSEKQFKKKKKRKKKKEKKIQNILLKSVGFQQYNFFCCFVQY